MRIGPIVKRSAALVALAVVVLAGCSATAVTGGSGTRSGTAHPVAPATHRAKPQEKVAAAAPHSKPAVPKPSPPNACAKNTEAQLVRVSVTQQRVWMCAGTRTVYSAPVTTGAVDLPYDSTPTGAFQIQGKTTDTTLTLLSGETYAVKYWIPFQGPLFGFHDSSWQNFPYGSSRYRTEGSHGCVHTPLAAMRFLYDWAAVGTTVDIQP
jgi:lipoprotein-anchoring transpeptidase ErfK/SrfK